MGQSQSKISSDGATTSSAPRGNRLCDAVYSFHEPEGRMEAEIVFIHGLHSDGDNENAYWTTWLARDGTGNNCWPGTWLPEKFPNARILSLCYDACPWRTATTGRMDSYLLGENLVLQMTLGEVRVGQNDCPVVFVCHGVGGLIAKQIVVSGHRHFSRDRKVSNLLSNLKAIFFYDTPHGGSKLANLVGHIPFLPRSPLVECLEVLNEEAGRLNSEFHDIHIDVFKSAWKLLGVGAMHAASYGVFSAMTVEEASARHVGSKFLGVAANHVDVCKPKSVTDTGFQMLTGCITEVVEEHNMRYVHVLLLPSLVVGLECKLQELQKRMAEHSIVGLVGVGGIGKTTLSKHLYNHEMEHNRESHQFERFCFLEDVKSRGIQASQKKLLHDLCDEAWNENGNVETYLRMIRECIVKKKVLLVVDDVGVEKNMKELQLDAFKSGQTGSKVIVTTRERHILWDYCEGIFDVELLNEVEASDLFSHNAFHGVDDNERTELNGQAKAIIKACGELPLSLEVIGQFLRKSNALEIGERMGIWEEALRRLHEAKSLDGNNEDEKLWARLRISYDDLAKDEQSMFLDFAGILCETEDNYGDRCVRKDWLARIWSSPIGVQNLINRSLLKWNGGKQSLVMHDQLRDMGRRIVSDGNKNRIWKEDEGLKFMQQGQISQTLEGLVLCCDRLSDFPPLQISRKLKLEEMNVGGADCFEKMRLLNLERSGLEVVEYHVRLCSKALRWLRLNWTDITDMNIRDVGSLTNLPVLEMRRCIHLEELPESIGNLSLLTELDLSRCVRLKTLPDSIGNLKDLQVLKLRWCFELDRLPTSMGGLRSLRKLDFGLCKSLTEVPAGVGQLLKLEYLSFERCEQLATLCAFETKMDHLSELRLFGCSKLKTMQWFGVLHCLEGLDLGRCEEFYTFLMTM